jgi:prephenate dehydratase
MINKKTKKSKDNRIIAALGPKGTFSYQAACKSFKGCPNIIFKDTIRDVFESVERDETSIGIVPLENSLSGTVTQSIDSLRDMNINIVQEILVPIKHHLAADRKITDLSKIQKIFTHPVTFEQCEDFIRKNLSKAEIVQTASNAVSAKRLKKSKTEYAAAIVPEYPARMHKLEIIRKKIQDSRNNVTRFIAISKQKTQPTGKDRTSILIYPQVDRPGLLFSMLKVFAEQNINLTKIESLPSKGKLGDYIFYIELQGHNEEKHVKTALDKIEHNFFIKVLGSYPRKY